MRVTVAEVATLVKGTVVGDPTQLLTGVSSLTEATPGDITFLANPKYAPFLADCRASAVLVGIKQEQNRFVQIVVANPDYAFAQVVDAYGPRPVVLPEGVHPTAVIGEGVHLGKGIAVGAFAVVADGATLGDGCRIYPHTFVGTEASLGNDCILYPHVTVRERCALGDRVIIHSGAVIGSDGFGYASVEGVHHKIPQVGIVVVGDDVEIGANSTIDRARFGRTVIGTGTKIDNLVQIAHNVEIGEHCIIVAQVGVAGSTRLGRGVTLAGQAGLAGHITIGDHAIVAGQSGVSKNVPPRAVVQGYPAQDLKRHQTQEIALRRLPGTLGQVKALEQRVAELEARLAEGGAS